MTLNLNPFSADPQAASVLACLAEQKWRKARDFAKELCKKDRGRYLPLLILANEGLAQDLIKRQLWMDAEQVIVYLKSIAPASVIEDLERLKLCQNTAPTLASTAADHAWLGIVSLADALARQEPPPEKSWLLADQLVLHGSPSDAAQTPTALRVAAELAAVKEAIQATATGEWEVAQAALRTLPSNSVFQRWRMLLRGVRHAHLEEKAHAEQCFASLPPDSVPARAASLWQLQLNLPVPPAVKAPIEARATVLAVCVGAPPSWGKPLTIAQRLWKKKELLESYETLSAGLQSAFPTDVPGPALAITESLMSIESSTMQASEEEYELAEDFYQMARFENPEKHERWLLGRFAICTQSKFLKPSDVAKDFALLQSWAETALGKNPLRTSILWQELGKALTQPEPGTLHLLSARMRDAVGARAAYEKAVATDPLNVEAQTELLALLRRLDDLPALTKHVEAFLKRCPDNKHALLEAGRLAIKRKAFGKGTGFLRRVIAIDPLDRSAIGELVSGLLQEAMTAAKKKPAALAGIWAEIDSLGSMPSLAAGDDPGTMFQSAWWTSILQALIEPDEKLAQAYWDLGLTAAPRPAAAALWAAFAARHFKLRSTEQGDELLTSLLSSATVRDLAVGISVLTQCYDLLPTNLVNFHMITKLQVLANRGCALSATQDFPGLLHLVKVCIVSAAHAENTSLLLRYSLAGFTDELARLSHVKDADPRIKCAAIRLNFGAHSIHDHDAALSNALFTEMQNAGHMEWALLVKPAGTNGGMDAEHEDNDVDDEATSEIMAVLEMLAANLKGMPRPKILEALLLLPQIQDLPRSELDKICEMILVSTEEIPTDVPTPSGQKSPPPKNVPNPKVNNTHQTEFNF